MTSPIITEAVRTLVDRRDLTRMEAAGAMEAIMSGAATNAQIAAFLTALRMKGETVEELIGFAQVMRQKAVKVRARAADVVAQTGTDREMLIDTCGTGGDASGTFNVSTATAFVVAGAGLKVAKHGNRSVSSLCGSADVVEALGINIELAPAKVARCIDEAGIGFLYAPLLHTAMKHVMAARREMGIRTVFNMLGPLTNPAGANAQVIGVYAASLAAVRPDETAAVLGLGPVGYCTVQALFALGARTVFGIEVDPARRALAEAAGAIPVDAARVNPQMILARATGDRGADVVIEAVGTPAAYETSVDLVRRGGRIVVVGMFAGEVTELQLGVYWARALEVRFAGLCPTHAYWQRTMTLLAEDRLDPSPIVSHRLSLEEAARGYELFDQRIATKVLFAP